MQPIDQRRHREPPGRGGEGGGGDHVAGTLGAEMRQQERHLVHDEADLRGERQGERQRDAPDMRAAQQHPWRVADVRGRAARLLLADTSSG